MLTAEETTNVMLETMATITVIIGRSSNEEKEELKKVFHKNKNNCLILMRTINNYSEVNIPLHHSLKIDFMDSNKSYLIQEGNVDKQYFKFGWSNMEHAIEMNLAPITGQLILECSF